MTKWRDQFLFVTWYHLYLLKKDWFVRRQENKTTDCSQLATLVDREGPDLPVFTRQPYWRSRALGTVRTAKRREIISKQVSFLIPANLRSSVNSKKMLKRKKHGYGNMGSVHLSIFIKGKKTGGRLRKVTERCESEGWTPLFSGFLMWVLTSLGRGL